MRTFTSRITTAWTSYTEGWRRGLNFTAIVDLTRDWTIARRGRCMAAPRSVETTKRREQKPTDGPGKTNRGFRRRPGDTGSALFAVDALRLTAMRQCPPGEKSVAAARPSEH